MTEFDYFPEGLDITNLTIVALQIKMPSQFRTRYRVKYHCCGEEGSLTHRRIRERVGDRSTLCIKCNRKRKRTEAFALRQGKKPAPVVYFEPWYHGWEPPPSCRTIERGWMPR